MSRNNHRTLGLLYGASVELAFVPSNLAEYYTYSLQGMKLRSRVNRHHDETCRSGELQIHLSLD